MAKLMRDALKDAYAKKGLELPMSKEMPRHSQPISENHRRKSKPANQPPSVIDKHISGAKKPRPETRPLCQPSRNLANKPNDQKTIKKSQPVQPLVQGIRLSDYRKLEKPQPVQSDTGQKVYADLREIYRGAPIDRNTSKPAPPSEPYELTITPDAGLHRLLSKRLREYQIIASANSGIAEQFSKHIGDADVREVVIGLDFGTSSVKVVVGDPSADIAYVVPFSNDDGIDRYLLPSRLWQTDDQFSLLGGNAVHRDLKLSLLHDNNPEDIERATAFLALVIRHARGWLFSEHAETYSNTKIVWTLVLGIPAANYSENPALVDKFWLTAKAAWLAAGNDKEEMFIGSITQAVSRARELLDEGVSKCESEKVEVDVVPELSAQICGFCVSQNFDRDAENIFMTVDVGAGTVDSSLFQVRKGEPGKWDFEFFTNHVQQYGVTNLHRNRVKWWSDALAGKPDSASQLVKSLNKNKSHTDHHGTIPDSMDDYLTGVCLKFGKQKDHPDSEFFRCVTQQVQSDTLYKAKNYLDQQQLNGIPMFLCGGGARMSYYQKLEQELANLPGTTWLKATMRALVIPKNLRAHGLVPADYDRLSVAFGLSFLEVGKIVRALPKPIVISNISTADFTDNFISKDVC